MKFRFVLIAAAALLPPTPLLADSAIVFNEFTYHPLRDRPLGRG